MFARRCVAGLEADAEQCTAVLERSLSRVTGLTPAIGYDAAAQVARRAQETGRTLREVALELTALDEAELDRLLDFRDRS